MNVYSKCSNYATDTCPCVLAENGSCIVCSMCRGEDICTCTDTVSYCILQELKNNKGKARPHHESIPCEVMYVKEYEDVFHFVRIKVPDAEKYKRLGAYVLIRTKENPFFDVPISVLYEDYENDTIGLLINSVGIKTKCLQSLKKGDMIYVRGPYFNGVQGRKSVELLKDGRALMICRGIGFIPSLHVIGTLRQNNNSVEVYVDEGQFSGHLLNFFRDLQEVGVKEVNICNQGELTDEICRIIDRAVEAGISLIHLGLSDYLQKKVLDYIEQVDTEGRMSISCINNAHISCGEGICGACTKNLLANHTVRLCKEQLSMRDYKSLL